MGKEYRRYYDSQRQVENRILEIVEKRTRKIIDKYSVYNLFGIEWVASTEPVERVISWYAEWIGDSVENVREGIVKVDLTDETLKFIFDDTTEQNNNFVVKFNVKQFLDLMIKDEYIRTHQVRKTFLLASSEI